MAVRVELTASLRKYIEGYNPVKGATLSDAMGKSVGSIIDELGIPSGEVTSIVVNYRSAQRSHVIKEGDIIGLVKAVGGG